MKMVLGTAIGGAAVLNFALTTGAVGLNRGLSVSNVHIVVPTYRVYENLRNAHTVVRIALYAVRARHDRPALLLPRQYRCARKICK